MDKNKSEKTNKGKKYDKPLSLYPMKVEEAIKRLLDFVKFPFNLNSTVV